MILLYRYISSCLLTVLFLQPLQAQVSHAQAKVIAAIRREVGRISRDTAVIRVTVSNEEVTPPVTEGGVKITGFYKKNKIVKINRWTGMYHGNESFDYYFKDNQLIYVHELYWAFPPDSTGKGLNYRRADRAFEGMYYFQAGKIYDYITTGHNRFENDELDPGLILLEEAGECVRLLEKKQQQNRAVQK
ncbi:hypothetical protein [Chitinophaga solisilvae]|uniref:Uncharacterized protein n=1 Tax=Chitinophaga solisilvae TaxID=1233460 RepID=A0A433WDW4_9BACT|nr:hypothetical protein [Chitinophaga solisilvae]NSL88247.1 hypothetical protein [Chitinophaga solisilvae]